MAELFEIRPFEKCIEKVKYTTKVASQDFKQFGRFPIISQEEAFISGYWDSPEDVFHISKPVVIFGDHSRHIKYIDFDFVIGADGVKILSPVDDINAKYFYYYLRWLDVPSLGYSRHFKSLKEKTVKVFPIDKQQRIVAELDLLTDIIDKKNAQFRDLDTLAQSIFYEMFGDPNANSLNWPSSSFKDIFKLKSGDGLKEKDFVTGQFPVYGGNGISGYHNAFNKEGKHIIIGRVGAYCGNVRVVEDCFWLTDNAFDAFFDSSVLDYYFVSWLLNTLDLHRFANHAAQPVISNSGLKDLLIILPPIEIQRHFSERVLAILQQKSSISNSIIDVERLLSERMDAYFS